MGAGAAIQAVLVSGSDWLPCSSGLCNFLGRPGAHGRLLLPLPTVAAAPSCLQLSTSLLTGCQGLGCGPGRGGGDIPSTSAACPAGLLESRQRQASAGCSCSPCWCLRLCLLHLGQVAGSTQRLENLKLPRSSFCCSGPCPVDLAPGPSHGVWQPARVLQCPCGKEQAQQACCHLPLAACVGFSIAWTARSVSPNSAGYLACSLGAEGLYGPLS